MLAEERSFMSEALAEIDLAEMGIHLQSELVGTQSSSTTIAR
jgi:hypothetical protein